MLMDEVKITCKAGDGGNGKVSFRREKFVPNGGPDGGDGGNGGSIIFRVTNKVSNLGEFRFKKHFFAENGQDGGSGNCYGKYGDDVIIYVPLGTVIRNAQNGKVLADMIDINDEIVLLKGGMGGRGNAKFATATRQAPRYSELGVKTKPFEIILELKTIADVGVIGFPNVGKSTLLSSVSNARPKIANYHFTTLAPNIGVVNAFDSSFVMADIPGLISGASENVGLGFDFLRHIERTRLLIHVVDISGSEGRDPFDDYIAINRELQNYSDKVANIPQIIALNKCDLLEDHKAVDDFKSKIDENIPVFEISAVSYAGLNELLKAVVQKLSTLPVFERLEVEEYDIDKRDTKEYAILKIDNHTYKVTGNLIEEITRRVVLEDYTSNAYFQKQLKDEGIIEKLKEKGLSEGDTVIIGDIEFEYEE